MGMVDIFEAGPLLSCPVKDIRIVQESRKALVNRIMDDLPQSPAHIIVAPGEEFRACMGTVVLGGDGEASVNSAVAGALHLSVGDPIRFSPTRPSGAAKEKS